MKRRGTVLAALVSALTLGTPGVRVRAQGADSRGLFLPTRVEQALRKADSGPLRDLPVAPPLEDTGATREGRPTERVIRNSALPRAEAADTTIAPLGDGALQELNSPVAAALTPPGVSFEGLSNQDNFNLFGFRVSPPDTVGDVGLDQYVQMSYLTLRVWNKAGAPLTAPAKTSSFWAPLGGICAEEDLGDPIVVYDDMADRWLISQFNSEDFDPGPHHQCIAVSQTGDATGSWFLYDFVMPNQKFNDYPKFGVWRDAYYMTDNQFSPFAFEGAGAFAFDRSKMLVGDPTASYIYFDLELLDPFIGGLLPADADGIQTPPLGKPGLFAFFTAGEFLDPLGDGLRLFEFRANFAAPLSSSFTEILPGLPVAPFDPRSPAGRRDIEQPPPATATNAVDSISDRLMHRLQYRNFGGYETLVVNHTVNVGTGTTLVLHRAGIRYYELRRSRGGAWGVHEQATFAPNDADNRWMGSAALDGEGNLAVGYSVSGLATFPSIRYAARLAVDPPGGLHQGEQTLVAGTGVQRSTSNRWGDYSAMTVDPRDDCTFWYTQEYYTAASQASSVVGWLTRVGSFKADPNCQPSDRGRVRVAVSDCETDQAIDGALVEVSNGASRAVFDGRAEITLPPGRYTIRVSAFGYDPAVERVSVRDGEEEGLKVCLKPIPVIRAEGLELVRETCRPRNDAIDPGERVSVKLTVRNIGAGDTRHHLWGRLLPGGGVQHPSPPARFFGDLDPGESAARTFHFTAAGACGGEITLRLALFDGFRPLGSVEYEARLGERIDAPPVAEANSTPIDLLDNRAALPYPSTITVAGAQGRVDKVTVTLHELSHTFPADTAFLLVGPGGQSVVLMANRGQGFPVSGVTLTFDDDAARTVTVPMASGIFKPSLGFGLPLPAPAPPGPHASALAAFEGTDPNGTWSLFAVDQFALDVGSVAGGWSITVNGVEYHCPTSCRLPHPTR